MKSAHAEIMDCASSNFYELAAGLVPVLDLANNIYYRLISWYGSRILMQFNPLMFTMIFIFIRASFTVSIGVLCVVQIKIARFYCDWASAS